MAVGLDITKVIRRKAAFTSYGVSCTSIEFDHLMSLSTIFGLLR